MKIHGIERGFFLSVAAWAEIQGLCPNEDLGRLSELLENPSYKKRRMATAKIICALSTADENAKKYTDAGYQKPERELTAEELFSLPENEFEKVQEEAFLEFAKGQETTVEAEEKPGKKTV